MHYSIHVSAPTSNHQGYDLQGMVLTNNLTDHWLALGRYYLIQQRRVYPIVWVGTLPNDNQGNTGGKGSITQWVHAEYMEGSETIHPTFTQWVRGGYFSKVPTKVPTG